MVFLELRRHSRPCSALKGETVPDSLPATPKSPPTRRVPPRRGGQCEALGTEGPCPQGHRVGAPATPTSPSFPPGPEVTAGTWRPPCAPCRAGRRSCSCPGAEGQPAGHGWRRGVLPPGPAVKVKVPGDGRGRAQRQKQGGTQSCQTLRPHEPQHTRPPCPSPTPGVYPNSCPLSW